MSAKDEARRWAETVQALAADRALRYEPVGGLNPPGAPAALCPGGTNRITGELAADFWGAACDAEEREEGRLFSRVVLPRATLVKWHLPRAAEAIPEFNVESLEARPDDLIEARAARNRVRFESIEFNRRFLATVTADHDPVALRELFGPGFIDWVTTIDRSIDFGVSERQAYFLWRLRERTREELGLALEGAAELFRRSRRELVEHGVEPFRAGPWHAGLDPFPEEPA